MLLLRLSLPLVFAVWIVPLSGAAAPSKSAPSGWGTIKRPKRDPAKMVAPHPPPPPAAAARAGAGPKSKGKSDGPNVSGKVAVFGFTGDGAARVQHAVVSTLRTRGLQVTTGLRPVDSAEQYREMAATLHLAAYIDGNVGGDGSQATVNVRSGLTGRRIASVRFSGDRNGLPADVGNGLWPRTGGQLARLCSEAAKPRKGPRRALRINAGTPIENTVSDDSDTPAHLRNDPKPRKVDPWADEGT